jgi:predicted O-methyltransferase YrrM
VTLDELRALAYEGRGGHKVFGAPYLQMSLTLEEAEFLYALVRLLKPERVLELGSGLGLSARFIAEALVENDSGWLTTLEPNHFFAAQARELLADLPVDVVELDSEIPKETPDLVFIDSGYDRREADIALWLRGDYEGLVVVHDAQRGYDVTETGVLLETTDGMWVGRA